MTPKSFLLTLAVSLALAGCSSDTMSRHDTGGANTTYQPNTAGYGYNDQGGMNNPTSPVITSEGATLSEADKAFIREAGAGGLFEVDSGRKVVDKATDPKIKTIGQRMIDDHTRLNKELADLASKKGFDETPTLTPEHDGELARLDQLNGKDFDRYYIEMGLDDHRMDVAKFEHEASSANDRDLRDWAGKSVPVLREHLRMFDDRARAIGVEKPNAPRPTMTPVEPGYERRPGFQPGQADPTGAQIQPSNPNSDGNSNRQ